MLLHSRFHRPTSFKYQVRVFQSPIGSRTVAVLIVSLRLQALIGPQTVPVLIVSLLLRASMVPTATQPQTCYVQSATVWSAVNLNS